MVEKSHFLTKDDLVALEAGADEVRSILYPGRTMRFASDGVGPIRHMQTVRGTIEVERGTADSRDTKKLVNNLPKEINGFPVVIKDVVSRCILCGFPASTRREMQRHKCDV